MPIKKIKQKKIKGKQKKKSSPKKRANVVASAPTRDVIININTTRPRARREPSQKVIPKRNEDLSARIIESELFQSNFRATQLIKEQAEKIKLFDRRLSVLTDVIDNERNRPLITEPAPDHPDQPPPVAEAIRTPSQDIQVAEAVRAPSQDIQVAEIVSEPAKPERPRQSVFLQQLLSERESQERLKQQAQRQEESERASLKARQLGEEQEEQPLERKKAGQGQPLERKKKPGRPAMTPEQKEENKRIREQEAKKLEEEAKKLVQQQKPPDTQPRKLTVLELMKLNQGEQQGELFFKSFGGRKV